jgi:hypothetical protein
MALESFCAIHTTPARYYSSSSMTSTGASSIDGDRRSCTFGAAFLTGFGRPSKTAYFNWRVSITTKEDI